MDFEEMIMKKIVTIGLAVLMVSTLVACSKNKQSETASNESTTVVTTIDSSTTEITQTQTSEFSILTDEEINKAKKIGEMKKLMPRLNAIAYKISDIRIASLPEEQQEFERSKAKLEAIQLEASTKKYNEHLSTYGPDDTFMPEPNRTYLLKEVIYYRDIIKNLAHKFGLDQ